MIPNPGITAARSFLQLLETALFPSRCQSCGEWLGFVDERVLCRTCRGEIVPWPGPRCPICGVFLVSPRQARCGRCAAAPPPFRGHRSFALYHGVLRRALHLFKYQNMEGLGSLFQERLWQSWQDSRFPPMDGIVPVPADPSRHHDFSPTLRLAELLSRKTGIPTLPAVLRKTRSTPSQAGLNQARRLVNLNGAFALGPEKQVRGKRLLLLDDILTTGATLRGCALVLTRGGSEVFALTLAQTPLARQWADPETSPFST